MTFAKKALKSAKKCKKLQKNAFHPHKGRFLTTYYLDNRIFSPISRLYQKPLKAKNKNDIFNPNAVEYLQSRSLSDMFVRYET